MNTTVETKWTVTPWGAPDVVQELKDGVTVFETPSHGGVYVPSDLHCRIPEAFFRYGAFAEQRKSGWFEEDCDMAIAIVFLPRQFYEHFGERFQKVYDGAMRQLAFWHRQALDESLGKGTPPEQPEDDDPTPTAWLELSKLPEGATVQFVIEHDMYPDGIVPRGTRCKVIEQGLNEMQPALIIAPITPVPGLDLQQWEGNIWLHPGNEDGAGDYAAADEYAPAPVKIVEKGA